MVLRFSAIFTPTSAQFGLIVLYFEEIPRRAHLQELQKLLVPFDGREKSENRPTSSSFANLENILKARSHIYHVVQRTGVGQLRVPEENFGFCGAYVTENTRLSTEKSEK